jgi:hypothetical protein
MAEPAATGESGRPRYRHAPTPPPPAHGIRVLRSGRPPHRLIKHSWLTETIVGIHTASRGTYGSRWVHAELGLGLSIHVSHGTMEQLMQRAGLPGNRAPPRQAHDPIRHRPGRV